MLILMSQPVIAKDKIVGIVGLDIQAAQLLEDVAYGQYTPSTHAVVMTRSGRVLSHPDLPTPEKWRESEVLMRVEHLEKEGAEGLNHVLREVEMLPSGNYVTGLSFGNWSFVLCSIF